MLLLELRWLQCAKRHNPIKGQCCCGHRNYKLLWSDLHPPSSLFPPPLCLLLFLCSSLSFSLMNTEQHIKYSLHMHTTHTAPLHCAHTGSNKRTAHAHPSLLFLTCLNAPMHTHTLQLFIRYEGKEPVQTEQPWKFNTPSVRRTYKHTLSHQSAQLQMQYFSFFYSHHESFIQGMSSVSLSWALCCTCILQSLNISSKLKC